MKKRHVLVKIGIIVAAMNVAAILLSTTVLFALFRNRAGENIKTTLTEQITSCCVELSVYQCSQDLIDYWNEHGAELTVPPFTDADMVVQWVDEHKIYDSLNAAAVTSEKFESMSPEKKKLFAECCYYNIFRNLTVNHLSMFELLDIKLFVPGEGDSARILMETDIESMMTPMPEKERFFPGVKTYDLSLHPVAKEMMQSEIINEENASKPTLHSEIELFRSPSDGTTNAIIYGRIGKVDDWKGLMSVAISIDGAIRAAWADTLKFESWLLVAMVVIFGVLLVLIYYSAVRPALKLQRYVRSYSEDKSRESLSENLSAMKKKADEFGRLARDMDDMAGEIQKYYESVIALTAEQKRIEAELDVATKIQAEQLPSVFPAFPERKDFDIYASMTPAKEVGGDFYDFFFLDEDHLALIIADVSGKGVPAALFMMMAKLLIRNTLQNGYPPAKALEKVNMQLLENNDLGFFVTVWLAVIDLKTGDGRVTNAGHEHPAVKRNGKNYKLVIYDHSTAVAFMPDLTYEEHGIHLNPGDRIFVYTDGVPEAQNEKGEFFGENRMIEALNREPDADPKQTLVNVMDSIREFTGEAEQFDDITMMCFQYFGE